MTRRLLPVTLAVTLLASLAPLSAASAAPVAPTALGAPALDAGSLLVDTLPTGVPAAADPRSKYLNAVSLTSATEGWAVGNANSFDSRPGNVALRWDGTGWTRTTTPKVGTYGFLSGVAAVTPSDAWAVGSRQGMALIEHWNGTRWKVADSAPLYNSYLLAVSASGASDAWAVGASSATFSEVLMHWDGTAWTRATGAGPQGSGLTAVEARTPSNVWASGYQGSVGAYEPLMEHWDGTSWTRVQPPAGTFPTGSNVNGISSLSAKDAWVAGSYVEAGVRHPLLARWNGTTWTVEKRPELTGNLLEVHMRSKTDVWAVGQSGTETLTMHYDGTSWTRVASPTFGTESMLLGVDSASDEVLAVGGYVTGSGARKSLMLRWDGAEWTRTT